MVATVWWSLKDYLLPALLENEDFFGKLPGYFDFPADGLVGAWLRWDAVHHVNLAMRGYFDLSVGDSVFYPLFAGLTRLVRELTRVDYGLAGLIVATIATFFTFALLYQLAEREFGPGAAKWAAAALAVYPVTILLLAPFTESLFLALTLAAFLMFYRRQWILGGAFGAFASLTRGPGMVTAAALGWIVLQQLKSGPRRSIRDYLQAALGLALPVAGGLAFVLWRDRAGFPPIGEVLQTYSGLEMINPLQGMATALKELFTRPTFDLTLDILSVILFGGVTVLMIAKPRWRRPEWIIYTGLNLILFTSKHSFIASPIQSTGRYVITLFPVFIVIGDWLAQRGPNTRSTYLITSSILLLVFSALYVLGFFIG